VPAHWRSEATRLQSVSVEVCWRPAQGEDSGDFHEVIDLTDGRVIVALGDAPSSGPAAAELAEELRFELRRAFRLTDRIPSALRALDEMFARRHVDSIATMVCVRLDPTSRQAEVANAGHLPILMTAGGHAEFLAGRSDPPLGVKAERQVLTYELGSDAALFMFTDGLVERREDSLEQGLAVVLGAARGLTGAAAWASELARRTTSRLGQPTDDATVVSVHLRAATTATTLGASDRVALRVYVDHTDLLSRRAEGVVRELSAALRGRLDVEFEVVDIASAPERAEADGVMAAPTVVRLLPAPPVRVVGGLRSAEDLARALQIPYSEEVS